MPRKNLFTSILIIASFLFMLFPPVPVLAAPVGSAWQDTTPDSEPANPGWERMSPWYADAGETATSSLIQINYFSPSDSIKEIFSYNSETKKWQAWPSLDDRKTGTVSATVQQTLDVVPSITDWTKATWINHPDTNLVNLSTSVQGNYAYQPYACRLLLNSGTGSATLTAIQSGTRR